MKCQEHEEKKDEECLTCTQRALDAALLQNGEWIEFAGRLVQKIHDLQHTGSSPFCKQPTCKAFYEKTEPEKRKCVCGVAFAGNPDGRCCICGLPE